MLPVLRSGLAAFALFFAASAAFAETSEKAGLVESVSGDQLVMESEDTTKTKSTFTVPSEATIMLDGKTAKLSELTKGDQVTVKTETKDGKTTVKSVDAKSGKMKANS